ncbi:uncharacterized protein LOC5512877 [Nematostella vectensis]|uniref:uncharacterized protein LOC5512877 n=1 Tax=Nematostella vectensis TaxID=45351 RepID=UPI0013903AA5|nr:uncharacterized protein LOC5512877 [Nematostella vectensis]
MTSHTNHTVFCKYDCTAKHCELILRLASCPDNKRLVKGLASLKQSLYEKLQEGWNPHSNVDDPLEEFQWPLVHWACVLGKDYALEWLFKMNFRPNAVNEKTGETAVHKMLHSLYGVCQHGGISIQQTFSKFLDLLRMLTSHDCDLLLIPESSKGNTALHTCATLIIRQEGATSELEYYEYCMTAILRRITAHKTSVTNIAFDALNYKNKKNKTVLHILAKKNISINILRYLVRKFGDRIDLSIEDWKNRTAMDVAVNKGASSIVQLLKTIGNKPIKVSGLTKNGGKKAEPIEIQDEEVPDKTDEVTRKAEKQNTPKLSSLFEKGKSVSEVRIKESLSSSTTSSSTSSASTTVFHCDQFIPEDGMEPVLSRLMTHQSEKVTSSAYVSKDTLGVAMEVVSLSGTVEIDTSNEVDIQSGELLERVQGHSSAPGAQLQESVSSGVKDELSEGAFEEKIPERPTAFSPASVGVASCSSSGDRSVISPDRDSGIGELLEGRVSSSPLIKLIHEEKDVVSILQARLEDKRERLRHELHEYTQNIQSNQNREGATVVTLREILKERDDLIKRDLQDAGRREKLVKELKELDASRTKTRLRMTEIEQKIAELRKASESFRSDFTKKKECYNYMKRKLLEYDEALSEISSKEGSHAAKKEKLS